MSATTATNLTRPWWEVAMPGASGASQPATQAIATSVPTWQGVKSDTGWSSTPNTLGGSVDYWAAPSTTGAGAASSTSGGSPFGYSYSSPGAGFNPWGMYDGRNGYDGTASDGVGLYNGTVDSKKGWGPNGTPESDRDRVWRMTLDDLKARGLDPGSADPATVQAAFLQNVARLHRDYDNTPGMTWAGSAFSGYDKLGAPGGAGQGAPTTTATTAGGASGQGTAQTGQGGASVNPPMGSGLGTGAQSAGVTTQPGGSVPPVPPTTNPAGQAAPMGGYYSTNPSAAVTQFLGQHNVGIGDHNPWAEFLRNLATGIATPIISTLPTGANGQPSLDRLNNLPQMLSDLIYGNGGQAFGNIANYGNTIQSQWTPDKLGTMTAPTVEKLLASIRAFQTLGDNPYMQSFNQQALSDLFSRYEQSVTGAAQSGQKVPNPNWLIGNQQADPFGLFR